MSETQKSLQQEVRNVLASDGIGLIRVSPTPVPGLQEQAKAGFAGKREGFIKVSADFVVDHTAPRSRDVQRNGQRDRSSSKAAARK